MRSIQNLASGVLADIVRRQQPSPERTSFAWQLAVGSTLARMTSVELEGTTLTVRSSDPRWLKEIDRAKAVVLPKIQHLLGAEAVTKLRTRL
jgi:predicted nucleic acid-binding Zn ribbon protein